MAEITPMMQQYFLIKAQYPDCLLFFRLGDFYEMFLDDAKVGAEELGLTLTTRDRKKPEEERTPMCGVPYHAADTYIARLISKGYKVAICEQMEDPATAKGLVDRDIIRIVTPGTAMDGSMLDESRNNYICSVYLEAGSVSAAFCDLSTGEFSVTCFHGGDAMTHLSNELGRFSPKEAVLSAAAWEQESLRDLLGAKLNCRCEQVPEDRFQPDSARQLVSAQFPQGLEVLPEGEDAPIQAAGALLHYLHETQKTDLSHINTLTWVSGDRYMELDLTAQRTLELTETMRNKEKKGSLLWVLDQTRTAMGSRMLRSWISRPLLSPVAIDRRLSAVEDLVNDPIGREELSRALREMTDLERLVGRISYGTAGGRDLVSLNAGLAMLPDLRERIAGKESRTLRELAAQMDDLPSIRDLITRAIVDDPPFSVREGGFIRRGFDPDVDHLRDIIENGADLVASVEAREKERTGIKNLKVRYNKVFGYYIEVSKGNLSLVPEDYLRKQTLVNCERFITQELKDLEHDILSAQDKITAMEYQLFCQVREEINRYVAEIQRSASAVAQLDVLCSLASIAADRGYCRPVVDESDVIEISEGRHPVVERVLKGSLFVPNDTQMNGSSARLAIITGPNMAGKSTYMRQVALIVLMAQMGSFVPARSAHIGIVDRIFTRIGASDDLAGGQSTFMVEMTEVAEMLKHATRRSLLILDEIGRGTSTYDGMSIARAVLEHCADRRKLGAKTLFATHYHELTVVEQKIEGVKNYHIAAKKRNDGIVFLRKIVPGGADQSYGIEVAKLAGVPNSVINRARSILSDLESQNPGAQGSPAPPPERDQFTLEDITGSAVLETLRETSVETLTPIEAMNLLYDLKQKL